MTATTVLMVAAAHPQSELASAPSELGAVDWSRTPSQVIASPVDNEPLIWVGEIVGFSLNAKGPEKKVELEWVCRHLAFLNSNESAISDRPIKVRPHGEGYFLVNLIAEIPRDVAESMKTDLGKVGSYILAAGRFENVVTRDGKQVVFLRTLKMEQDDRLVEVQNIG